MLGWGHRVHHERWQGIDCAVLILSLRVIIAIRTSRPIKAEGVCAGRTCQRFINKVNHRPRSHQSQPKKGREGEESLGRFTWAPLQRSTVIKGTGALNLHFPLRVCRRQWGWNIYLLDFCRNGQMLGANGATAQRKDSLKTQWLKRFTAYTSNWREECFHAESANDFACVYMHLFWLSNIWG